MNKKFLLSDEKSISAEDLGEREMIYNSFCNMPKDFFSKLRHLQPQIGCLNCCAFCSKSSTPIIEYWNESRIRNVIAALKYSSKIYKKNKPLIVWDRKHHRNGIVFSYSDNDIGNYIFLDKFVKIVYDELGVKTRISTVGYSRFNEKLNKVHSFVANNYKYLGGVRLSFTPYAIGWCSKNEKYSQHDYMLDISNFLKIYRPYYENVGSGYRKMCVELRYKPLANIKEVIVGTYNDYYYIYTDKYLYISCDKNISFNISNITDPLNHSIKLSEKPIKFYYQYLDKDIKDINQYLEDNNVLKNNVVDVYMLNNEDGIYYSVEPSIKDTGNYGINIYPKSIKREQSGYLITERFFINTLIEYKRKFNLLKSDKFINATWNDVNNVIEMLQKLALSYKNSGNNLKANYIQNEIISMITPYADALKNADYPASCFFDPDFTIDTGIICNMGRAILEFKGLTNKINNPMTPTHERNYGKTNSTMIVEDVVWKLNCGYDNTIVIEKLNLCNTATEQGQVIFKKNIKLAEDDNILKMSRLDTDYLIPGQKGK